MSLCSQFLKLTGGTFAQSLPQTKSSVPHFWILEPILKWIQAAEARLQAGYNDAGMWDIIPLILDLEASLNFAIGSKRPHRELKTMKKHNSDKFEYDSPHTVKFYRPYSRPLFRLVASIWYRSHSTILTLFKQHCIYCHYAALGLVKPVTYDLQTSHVYFFWDSGCRLDMFALHVRRTEPLS